jgi:hypothetical protein
MRKVIRYAVSTFAPPTLSTPAPMKVIAIAFAVM